MSERRNPEEWMMYQTLNYGLVAETFNICFLMAWIELRTNWLCLPIYFPPSIFIDNVPEQQVIFINSYLLSNNNLWKGGLRLSCLFTARNKGSEQSAPHLHSNRRQGVLLTRNYHKASRYEAKKLHQVLEKIEKVNTASESIGLRKWRERKSFYDLFSPFKSL